MRLMLCTTEGVSRSVRLIRLPVTSILAGVLGWHLLRA
jgi:hypothetical protein